MPVPSPEAKRDRLASPAWGTNGNGRSGIASALVEHSYALIAKHVTAVTAVTAVTD